MITQAQILKLLQDLVTEQKLALLMITLARIPDYKITKVDDLLPWKWCG